MFRRSRETAPSAAASELGRVLEPLPVLPWGALALGYLGVPIIVGVRSICLCFSLTIPVLDKYGGSSTLAHRFLRLTGSLYCHSRRGLSDSKPEITRSLALLYPTAVHPLSHETPSRSARRAGRDKRWLQRSGSILHNV